MKAAEVQERFEYIKSRAAEAGAMDAAKRQQYAEKLMVWCLAAIKLEGRAIELAAACIRRVPGEQQSCEAVCC
jgi:hypothetical protein